MAEITLITTKENICFEGSYCPKLETRNWHYYKNSDGQIIHVRKEHLVAVIGGTYEDVLKSRASKKRVAIKERMAEKQMKEYLLPKATNEESKMVEKTSWRGVWHHFRKASSLPPLHQQSISQAELTSLVNALDCNEEAVQAIK